MCTIMKLQRKLIVMGVVSAVAILLLYSLCSFSQPVSFNKEILRDIRHKRIYEYPTVVSSAIESLFTNLKVHNCSDMKKPTILWNNTFWQWIEGSSIYLYSAHYDSRYVYWQSEYHYIRIIGMSKGKIKESQLYYCTLWYNQEIGEVGMQAEVTEVWLQQWNRNPFPDTYHTYLISCPVPLHLRNHTRDLTHVSVSPQVCCKLTTMLQVHKRGIDDWKSVGEKKQFAVCVKGMDFKDDISLRLIEWLELLSILGADHIFMYKYSVHENVDKVLNYYIRKGRVTVFPLTLPGDQPNEPKLRSQFLKKTRWQKRRNELVPYNDCLYKNIYLYEYIIPLDIDEVILPVKAYTWSEMLTEYIKVNPTVLKRYASLSAQNAYFFDTFNSTIDRNVPKYFHMLQHVIRSANFSLQGHSVKSFVATRNTRSVFNHYSLESLYVKMKSNIVMNTSLVQMNHYKERCPREIYSQCKSKFLVYTKEDYIVKKYKEQLVPRVKSVIATLRL